MATRTSGASKCENPRRKTALLLLFVRQPALRLGASLPLRLVVPLLRDVLQVRLTDRTPELVPDQTAMSQLAHRTELNSSRFLVITIVLFLVGFAILEEAQSGALHSIQQRISLLAHSPPFFLDSLLILLVGSSLGRHLGGLHVVAISLGFGTR